MMDILRCLQEMGTRAKEYKTGAPLQKIGMATVRLFQL